MENDKDEQVKSLKLELDAARGKISELETELSEERELREKAERKCKELEIKHGQAHFDAEIEEEALINKVKCLS